MRRALLSLLIGAALLAGIPAQAFWNSRDSNYNVAISSGATYTGPIDIVASPTAWYGLRAGSGAIAAAGTQKLVNVRRASDNVACDFLVASNGGFGVTTATCNSSTQGGVSFGTFVGSDGTASCTLAGTTGACTGASGTVHVNDTVTGTGLTQPCIVASASNTAPTIEIAGTTTSCGTVGVAETFTFQVAGFVTEAYDQTGNGHHATQATAGNQPQLIPTGANGLPFLLFTHSLNLNLSSSASLSGSQPNISLSLVSMRTGTTGAFTTPVGFGSSLRVFYNNSVNAIALFAGSGSSIAAASDNTLHAVAAVFNGASSILSVDGTQTTVNPGTGNFSSLSLIWGTDGYGGSDALDGQQTEMGYWALQFTSPQIAAIRANEKAFYGTP